jgi:hypothetical protein
VPLEGLEPPTLSLGRNCSSIELQRRWRDKSTAQRGGFGGRARGAKSRLGRQESRVTRPEGVVGPLGFVACALEGNGLVARG